MPHGTPFTFHPELTPQANVAAFFEHLRQYDEELAALLRDNIGVLVDAQERNRTDARKRVHRTIAMVLDESEEESS